ncbi:MAG: hypothetical protein WBW73_14680 [Rhodoplanes sp.]
MPPKAFAPQVLTSRAASAIGIEHELLRKWRLRFGLFGTAGEPKRDLTVPEVLTLRCAVIAVRRHGFPVAEAIGVCAKTALPAFERILRGDQPAAMLSLTNEKTGKQVTLDLNAVVAFVLPKLGLGFVTRQPSAQAERARPTEAQLLTEVERVQRYLGSSEFRERLAAFRAEVNRRGTPTNWREACDVLQVPFWIFQLATASPPIVEAVALPLGLPPPSKADLQEQGEERQ